MFAPTHNGCQHLQPWWLSHSSMQWCSMGGATGAVALGAKLLGGTQFQYWTGVRDSGSANSPLVSVMTHITQCVFIMILQ